MSTVAEAFMIMPGPPGTQPGNMQGPVMSVIRAAGLLSMSTFGCPLMIVNGKGGCGTGVGTGAGGWMGAWQCGPSCKTISPSLAAGGISLLSVPAQPGAV